MPDSLLLLRVAATWPLPGLGLLTLPAGPTPHLQAYDLHAALPVVARLPTGAAYHGVATVEEVTTGPAAAPVRGLLLDLGAAVALPPDSEIWLPDVPQPLPEVMR